MSMKMCRCRPGLSCLLGTLLSILHCQGASAQVGPCVPPRPACRDYYLDNIDYDVIVLETIGDVKVTPWDKGPWRTNPAYDCGLPPCGEVNPPTDPVEVSYRRETEYCYSVGGSASAAGKSGLLMSLLGRLDVQFEFNGEFTYCQRRSEEVTWSIPSNQCFHNKGRLNFRNAKVSGTIIEAAVVYYYVCVDGPTDEHVTTTCGERESSGDADRLWEEVFQLAYRRPSCGGPPPNPEHDGVFMEYCCRTECTPGPPCCGCNGGG
jgi:hypothetical protein